MSTITSAAQLITHTQRHTHTPLFLFKVSWLYDRLKNAWELLAQACDTAILCDLWMDRLATM